MYRFLYIFLLLPLCGFTQTYELSTLNAEANSSIRGLSVVSDSVIWLSGSNGFIGRSADGGQHWKWTKPKGYEQLDFRDIEAFDDQHAVVVNAGSPACILQTSDGGKSWTETYKDTDTAAFLDGIDFWDRSQGIAFGDPVNHHFRLLLTADGGATWTDASSAMKVEAAEGEAAFAASGTSIRTRPGGKVWVVSGGSRSNVYASEDYGLTWKKYDCPVQHGAPGKGAFSIDFLNDTKGIVVGGDYKNDKDNSNNILLTADGGKSWRKPSRPVFGYRSGVIWYDERNCIATGTSGTDVSRDGGMNWYHISDESFNAIAKAKKGKLIILAGNKGQIYSLKLK